MQYVLWYLIVLMVILLILFFACFVIPEKRDRLGTTKVFYYITKRYGLNMDKKRVRLLSKIIVVANSFILSVPIMIVLFVDLRYLEALGLALIIFIPLILFTYNLIGYILKKKGW